jgi:hypothetical protein
MLSNSPEYLETFLNKYDNNIKGFVVMDNELESMFQRIETLEKKQEIIMSMLNHLNNQVSDIVLNKIEFDIEEAVEKKLNYIKTEQNKQG